MDTIEYEGKTYQLKGEAYVDDIDGELCFAAEVEGHEDWKAYWTTVDWDAANGNDYGDCCDWEHPDSIIDLSGYDIVNL